MLKQIKNNLRRYINNWSGWQTDRKIVVIESDDWGSIRMPSRDVYVKCLKAGYPVDQTFYERFDSLASEKDLELLFEVLNRYKDKNGNPAVLTANVLAANPDFEKIKASGYEKYFYELITETFKRYPEHSDCFNLWKDGMDHNVFFPQSHGREHVNVSKFMKDLQKGNKDVHFGFQHKMPGCIAKRNPEGGNKYVVSLNYFDPLDKKEKLDIIIEGLELFEKLFGFQSKSFTPPNYIWSPDYNEKIADEGVRYYQGRRKMKEKKIDGTYCLNNHSLGEENKYGQKYLIRNAIFEPSLFDFASDPVDSCLKDIRVAFRMNKPAIICSHRINYVGFIDADNRDKNLKLLNDLLKKILRKWPDVEFMNSVELGKLMDEHSRVISND